MDPRGLQAFVEYSEQNEQSEVEAQAEAGEVGRFTREAYEETAEGLKRLKETGNLRVNMEKYGDVLGRQANPGDQAHHIVERTRSAVQLARDILEKWGIDIDSHYNGLWLERTTHYRTYVRAYTEALNNVIKLADSGGQEAVLSALREIAEGILAGSFP